MTEIRRLVVLVIIGAFACSVDGHAVDIRNLITSNVSGYLVSRDGQFFMQPILTVDGSSKTIGAETRDESDDESGVTPPTDTPIERFTSENSNDDDDDGISWQKRQRSWWQRIVPVRSRSRSFSLFGVIESTLNTVTKFIGGMIFEDENDDEVDYQGSGVSYKGFQLMSVVPKTQKQVKYLQELRENEPDDVKFWNDPSKNRKTDIVVSPGMLIDVKGFLKKKKINYQVLISDVEKAIKSQNPRVPKERRQDLFSSQGHSMTWKRYHRFKDIMDYIDYLVLEYPHLVEVETIGKSFEGRPLKVIKVSSGADLNGEPKPGIWIDAGMHAREWISPAVATYILNQLVEKNENYTRLLNMTDWIVMPVANPDGYEFTHTNDRLWRKTRSVHDDSADDEARQSQGILHMFSQYTKWLFGTCEGVDPNRNFDIHWGDSKLVGASNDPCHDTYAGPGPFSEPETKAISDYLMEHRNSIKTYLTLHSYSQMLLLPWGFTTRSKPADFNDLMSIATEVQKAIANVYGTQYKVGPAAELLYPTTGSSDDWAKAVAGIKNSFTLELRDRGHHGFLLPASQIMPTARETWAGVRVMARMAAIKSKA